MRVASSSNEARGGEASEQGVEGGNDLKIGDISCDIKNTKKIQSLSSIIAFFLPYLVWSRWLLLILRDASQTAAQVSSAFSEEER